MATNNVSLTADQRALLLRAAAYLSKDGATEDLKTMLSAARLLRTIARSNDDTTTQAMQIVADRYAHRMAMHLECILLDYHGKWYDEAAQTLGEYRLAMNAIHEAESPTFMGEPLIRRDCF